MTNFSVVIVLTYDDTKVLAFAHELGLLKGHYVFIVIEGNADYLQKAEEMTGVDASKVWLYVSLRCCFCYLRFQSLNLFNRQKCFVTTQD